MVFFNIGVLTADESSNWHLSISLGLLNLDRQAVQKFAHLCTSNGEINGMSLMEVGVVKKWRAASSIYEGIMCNVFHIIIQQVFRMALGWLNSMQANASFLHCGVSEKPQKNIIGCFVVLLLFVFQLKCKIKWVVPDYMLKSIKHTFVNKIQCLVVFECSESLDYW